MIEEKEWRWGKNKRWETGHASLIFWCGLNKTTARNRIKYVLSRELFQLFKSRYFSHPASDNHLFQTSKHNLFFRTENFFKNKPLPLQLISQILNSHSEIHPLSQNLSKELRSVELSTGFYCNGYPLFIKKYK